MEPWHKRFSPFTRGMANGIILTILAYEIFIR